MNLDLIIKLTRLANNNPNENEANLAARKVCKLLAEAEFKFTQPPVTQVPYQPVTKSDPPYPRNKPSPAQERYWNGHIKPPPYTGPIPEPEPRVKSASNPTDRTHDFYNEYFRNGRYRSPFDIFDDINYKIWEEYTKEKDKESLRDHIRYNKSDDTYTLPDDKIITSAEYQNNIKKYRGIKIIY